MGNFASSPEWVNAGDNEPSTRRHTITPRASVLPVLMPKVDNTKNVDIVSLLVSNAISTCKQSIHRVLTTATDKLHCCAEPEESEATTSDEEEDLMDEIFNEFQIVYEDNYVHKKNSSPRQDELPVNDLFQEAPWFQYSPSDFDTFATVSAVNWTAAAKKDPRDDDCRSATTDSTDWLSESDDTTSENPASSVCSDLDTETELGFDDDDDQTEDVETKVERLLRMASTPLADEKLLFVDDYLCACGKCPLYATIEDDVARIVTWHGPEELISITRILQAFSTYNETIAYDVEMIATADELLRIWCGDEDQAFSSFVVLHDDVPFLCGAAV
jgi:hypothetical protein